MNQLQSGRWAAALGAAAMLAAFTLPCLAQRSQQTLDQEIANGPSLADTLDYINSSFLPGDVHYELKVSADHATLTWKEVDPDGTTITRSAPAAALNADEVDPAINGTVGDLDIACRGGSACAQADGKPVNSFYVQGFVPDDSPLADAQDAMHHLLVLLQAEAAAKPK